MSLPIAVVGGGSFGQSLARASARVGQRVLLWSRRPRELPEESITCTTELRELADAELVLFAVPSPHVGEVADELGHHLDGSHLLVHVSRGLVGDELHTVSEVLAERTPCRRVGALAGPLVAKNLASDEPSGAIIGSQFPEVVEAVSEALGGPSLRVYSTPDLVGVELASALVGLVALSLGYAMQMGMGPGALAVLATRGLAEATRVGEPEAGSRGPSRVWPARATSSRRWPGTAARRSSSAGRWPRACRWPRRPSVPTRTSRARCWPGRWRPSLRGRGWRCRCRPGSLG